jgi:hypothetical protein
MANQRPTLLAVLLERGDCTNQDVVVQFQQCARKNGEDATLSIRTLRRWVSGDVRTAPRPSQRRVARIYWGYPMTELLAPPPEHVPESQFDSDTVRPSIAPRGGFASLAPKEGHSGSVKELERQLAMATRRTARFATFAEVDNVGPEAIAQLRDDVVHLANTYLQEPLAAIMGDLVATQDLIFRLLEGRQRPNYTNDLFVLGAVVSGMLSKASQDLGRPREAMTHARSIYVCADKAGHRGLQVWARGQQALIAFRAGRSQESAKFAFAGEEMAAHSTGSVAVWLPSLRARALAQFSRPRETREAIAMSLNSRDHSSGDDLDEIGGLFTFSRAKQHYYAAGTYVFLDEGDADAEREALMALDLYESSATEERAFASEAGTRTELALARVHGGQIEGAHEALSKVLALAPERRIGGILHGLRHVHQALHNPRYVNSVAAHDLRDDIEAFSRSPAAALSA